MQLVSQRRNKIAGQVARNVTLPSVTELKAGFYIAAIAGENVQQSLRSCGNHLTF